MRKLSLLVVLVAVLMSGCATTGSTVADTSDTDGVMLTLQAFSAGLVAQDIDAIMATVSEEFESSETSSKKEVTYFFQDVIDKGYLDGVKVYLEDVNISTEGNEAEAFEFDVSSNQGSATLDLWLKKESGVWMITDMESY